MFTSLPGKTVRIKLFKTSVSSLISSRFHVLKDQSLVVDGYIVESNKVGVHLKTREQVTITSGDGGYTINNEFSIILPWSSIEAIDIVDDIRVIN